MSWQCVCVFWQRLGVMFTHMHGESMYHVAARRLVEQLDSSALLQRSRYYTTCHTCMSAPDLCIHSLQCCCHVLTATVHSDICYHNHTQRHNVTVMYAITRLPSNLRQDHPWMHALSYVCSLPVTWQRWQLHRSIHCTQKPHAARKHHDSMFDRTGVIAVQSFTLQE